MNELLTPAAQYLRMSTDRQQYSLNNQADAITQYAAQHGFQIAKTYSDAAKSGLQLKNRPGLKQLLRDVMGGQSDFRAVLVYDVSRWGRFQDMDEAAHYEYLCKSSGVPIHYCAETFTNDVSGHILKALKRTMAGEYSRELSVKVRTGLFRLASLGYKLGGTAVYGLRRQLLDVHGRRKQLLAHGERKSLANEHVALIPGPAEEISTVRKIYGYFANEHRSPNWIAARLNRQHVPYFRGTQWKAGTIRNILQDPRYIGMQVWGRTTAYLSSPPKRLPVRQWAVCPDAFEAIISQRLFTRAQQEFANYTCRLTDEQLLERLRQIHEARGRLSGEIIEKSRICPSLSTYNKRFGGLLSVYARLGYNAPERSAEVTTRQRVLLLRRSLINNIVETFPGEVDEVRRNGRFRSLLRFKKTGLLISVMVGRCCRTKLGVSWLVQAPMSERKRTTVLVLLNESNASIKSLTVLPRLVSSYSHVRLRGKSELLRTGQPLEELSDLLTVVRGVRQQYPPASASENRHPRGT
jgi:DNA invertase Pin-like site-specific DNA recombinase